MLNSTATKIVFQNQGGKKVATGVEFIYNNRPMSVRILKEVIVSGGTVNSPQILLLSGVGPKRELDRVGIQQFHELPGVGRNLHNHVTFYMSFLLKKRQAINDLDWASALDYLLNRRGPLSSTGMSQLTARISSKFADPSGNDPDLQMFFAGYLANCAKTGEARALEDPSKPDTPKHLTVSPVVLHPKSRGYITLKSKNPLDDPLIYVNYLTQQQDVATLIDGIRVAQKLGNTRVLKEKYGIEYDREEYGDCGSKHQYDSDQYWECAVRHSTGPENHQVGSCKMGPASDSEAVVDPTLKVHGIDNVRVMDCSVMPMIVSGNTHATAVMIAEKGVDSIKKRWQRSPDLSNRGGFPVPFGNQFATNRNGNAFNNFPPPPNNFPTTSFFNGNQNKNFQTGTFQNQNAGGFNGYPYQKPTTPFITGYQITATNRPNPFHNHQHGYSNNNNQNYNYPYNNNRVGRAEKY